MLSKFSYLIYHRTQACLPCLSKISRTFAMRQLFPVSTITKFPLAIFSKTFMTHFGLDLQQMQRIINTIRVKISYQNTHYNTQVFAVLLTSSQWCCRSPHLNVLLFAPCFFKISTFLSSNFECFFFVCKHQKIKAFIAKVNRSEATAKKNKIIACSSQLHEWERTHKRKLWHKRQKAKLQKNDENNAFHFILHQV